jgi:hypothetical protein
MSQAETVVRASRHDEPEPQQDGGGTASLTELLDRIQSVADDRDPVAVDDVLDAVGKRSFSPVMLVAGLIMLAPIIGDIPGVPVFMGFIVIIAAIQLMLGREHLWAPQWILERRIASDKLQRVLGWLRKPCRFVDEWTRQRFEWALRRVFVHAIAVICIVIAATTPLLEIVPFSANLAGIAITAFAIALFVGDGLIALAAIVFSAGTLALLLWQLI